jgi:hypothetical protein
MTMWLLWLGHGLAGTRCCRRELGLRPQPRHCSTKRIHVIRTQHRTAIGLADIADIDSGELEDWRSEQLMRWGAEAATEPRETTRGRGKHHTAPHQSRILPAGGCFLFVLQRASSPLLHSGSGSMHFDKLDVGSAILVMPLSLALRAARLQHCRMPFSRRLLHMQLEMLATIWFLVGHQLPCQRHTD